MKWTAIIPARANSKGLLSKNLLPLCGKPLFMYAVDQAIAAGADRVVVTTDIQQIILMDKQGSFEVLLRPQHLALDATPMASVILHACTTLDLSGTLVLLQPTSPLRRPEHIQMGLTKFEQGGYDLVMSITQADNTVLKWGQLEGDIFVPIKNPSYCFSNRQQLPILWRPNGAIYVFDSCVFVERGGFPEDNIGAICMSPEESMDIDTIEDFECCDRFLRNKGVG